MWAGSPVDRVNPLIGGSSPAALIMFSFNLIYPCCAAWGAWPWSFTQIWTPYMLQKLTATHIIPKVIFACVFKVKLIQLCGACDFCCCCCCKFMVTFIKNWHWWTHLSGSQPQISSVVNISFYNVHIKVQLYLDLKKKSISCGDISFPLTVVGWHYSAVRFYSWTMT